MTREEAINRLKTDVYKYADFSENPNENEFWDAFDMAITALEQESYYKDLANSYEKTINKLTKAIAVQEPKAGHWIRVTDNAGHLVWECDKCCWQQRFYTKFCPDCGAKIKSEVSE